MTVWIVLWETYPVGRCFDVDSIWSTEEAAIARSKERAYSEVEEIPLDTVVEWHWLPGKSSRGFVEVKPSRP